MTMFLNRILSLGLFGALATVGALQAGQQAKFHLPVSATWGAVTLAPGDYSVTLPEVGMGHWTFYLKGEDTQALIPVMTMGQHDGDGNEHSYLTLRNINGTYYVESYNSGSTSKEFDFMLPKASHHVKYGKLDTLKVDSSGM